VINRDMAMPANGTAPVSQELPSWEPGPAKTAILDFIRRVTGPGGSFVPPPERIAAFGHYGTLWSEQPADPAADLPLRRWREMAHAQRVAAARQPWRAVIEDDQVWLASLLDDLPGLPGGLLQACEPISVAEFDTAMRGFFDAARHPVLGMPHTQIAYRPMCELITLLEASQFQVYVGGSADGRDFVRVVSLDLSEGPARPASLWARTGRQPLLAAGNADGDIAMLEMAQLALLVCHDDAQRELSYRAGTETALAQAARQGWTVISMKDDFTDVY
jgi:hypothetical protein